MPAPSIKDFLYRGIEGTYNKLENFLTSVQVINFREVLEWKKD